MTNLSNLKCGKGSLHLGTSGLILPAPNKSFYPQEFQEKSRLNYYSSLINSIEINSSFYKIPRSMTIAKWATEVPESFHFSFKLFREITHSKELVFNPQILKDSIKPIFSVGRKKGCLLLQFPTSLRIEQFPKLKILIDFLNQFMEPGWKIAIEFRHKSWYNEEIYNWLNYSRIGMVLHDKPPAITPMVALDVKFVYLRFHGPNGNYRGRYDESFLYEYGAYIVDWINEGKDVYAYFNNTMGDAFQNLLTLKEILQETI